MRKYKNKLVIIELYDHSIDNAELSKSTEPIILEAVGRVYFENESLIRLRYMGILGEFDKDNDETLTVVRKAIKKIKILR